MTTPPGLRRLVLKRSQPIDPRKTPTQSRSEYTYGVILQASLDLLARGGLEGFTTNAVAKRAGVSVGSLYQYFPNKDAILATLVREMRTSMRDDFQRAVTNTLGLSLEASVVTLINASLHHHLDNPDLTALLEKVEDELPLDADTRALKAEMSGFVVTLLRDHAIPDAERTAFDLIALSHGIAHAATQAGQHDFEELSKRVQRAVFGYLDLQA